MHTLELFLERGFDPNASIEFGGAMPLMKMFAVLSNDAARVVPFLDIAALFS